MNTLRVSFMLVFALAAAVVANLVLLGVATGPNDPVGKLSPRAELVRLPPTNKPPPASRTTTITRTTTAPPRTTTITRTTLAAATSDDDTTAPRQWRLPPGAGRLTAAHR